MAVYPDCLSNQPGEIGTNAAINVAINVAMSVTVNVDENGQAPDKAGKPIGGLYAAANTALSVMGRTYPGAGSTLGPAMSFGYVAAKHAMGVNS